MRLVEIIRSIKHPLIEPIAPETQMNKKQRWQFNADNIIASLESDRPEDSPASKAWIRKRNRRIKTLEFLIAKAGNCGVDLHVPSNPGNLYALPLVNGR